VNAQAPFGRALELLRDRRPNAHLGVELRELGAV